MARPKKPEHLKILEGTFRPDRADALAPSKDAGPLVPPLWLPFEAVEIFEELKKAVGTLGLDSYTYSTALGILALRIMNLSRSVQYLEDNYPEGFYETTNMAGAVKMSPHPSVSIASEAMRHAQSLLGEFGLTPGTTGRVARVDPHDKERVNKWASVNKKKG